MSSSLGVHTASRFLRVTVNGSRRTDGGLKLRAVGSGSIHRLSCVLLGRRVTLGPLGANRRGANTVGPGT